MAYDFTDRKTLAETLITGLTGLETDKQLAFIYKVAQGVNASNYQDLEDAIQTFADAQTAADPLSELAVISAIMGANQARTYSYVDEQVVTGTNANYPVPANAVSCLVSCTAGSLRTNLGGGAYAYDGGAYIVDFEIGVSAGGTINVEVGLGSSGSHVIGNLEVFSGIYQDPRSGIVKLAGVTKAVDNINVFTVADTSVAIGTGIAASDITLKFQIEEVV